MGTTTNRFYIYTLIIISGILGYLAYQVLSPFLTALAWGGVLSILFYPLFVYLSHRMRWKGLAAGVTLLIILIIILGPFSFLSIHLVGELKDVAAYIERGELVASITSLLERPSAQWVLEKFQPIINTEGKDIGVLVGESLSNIGKKMLGSITTGAKNLIEALLNFIFMSLTIFFFLRDGTALLVRLRGYLPFSDEHKMRLEGQTKDMVISTVFGGVVVALIQGLVGGVAFYFLSVPAPVLWGTGIAILSFIPMIGSFTIWGPVMFYLFVNGMMAKALILLIVGTFGISMVDNVLKPVIIGNRTKMPTLLIFFSVLGGLKTFGIIGLIMGPLVIALFISVLEIFRNIEGPERPERPEIKLVKD